MDSTLSLHGVCDIADWGVIRADGVDADKFLQGQLTNDVIGLDAAHARLAGFCSAKGRLQASFVVWRTGDDGFLLACSRSLLAPTLKRLSMFVLRARCKLSDASGTLTLRGAAGTAADGLLGDLGVWSRRDLDGRTAIRLPDADGVKRALLVAAAGPDAAPVAGGLTIDAWRWLEVRSGVVTIEAATVDRFVPQMVNYEIVGGVDFQKGCYPGQEVVARSQYRGTTKRRTLLFDTDQTAVAGQDVVSSAVPGEPVGTVASAAAWPGRPGGSALVEVRLSALDTDLHLGSVDGPLLRRAELPYSIGLEGRPAT
ncbi:MAG: folate-binding protein [Pseudomonadota bacterium]|nr:folate-binding protein [Pseudomonadota bacterium]